MMNANAALVELNVSWIDSAIRLLERLDERTFATPARRTGCRVSSQLRHVIEFYECFLDGLESTHLDYDARKRDTSLEASRAAAVERLRTITARLQASSARTFDGVLFVRIEDADAYRLCDPFLMSTVGRELLALSSHTVHHFALIAMTLRAQGIPVDADFGVAPSTLRSRHRLSLAAHEAA